MTCWIAARHGEPERWRAGISSCYGTRDRPVGITGSTSQTPPVRAAPPPPGKHAARRGALHRACVLFT